MPRLDFYVNSKLFVKIQLSDEILIGRGGDCQVQLPKDSVSRNHAVIRPSGEGYEIENLSSNGTRLNATMLEQPRSLAGGDRLYIADYVVIYQPDDAPSARLESEETVLG
ncbi:MAG: FHA domain-containing protein [Acidobacteriota bacterium]